MSVKRHIFNIEALEEVTLTGREQTSLNIQRKKKKKEKMLFSHQVCVQVLDNIETLFKKTKQIKTTTKDNNNN